MSRWIEVSGAYGRDYTTVKAAQIDWNAGKDFRMTDTGQYVSKAEAQEHDLKVIVRYSQNRKVGNLK